MSKLLDCGHEPYVGRKLTVKRGCTLDEARKICWEDPANKLLRAHFKQQFGRGIASRRFL